MKKRLIVGLTGSFGSGKSTVGRILKQLGARRVIDGDRLAHEVFRPAHPVGRRIKRLFHIQGAFNRKEIAKQVFSDSRKRRQLEALIHPYVFQRIRSELKRAKHGIVVLEIPLLFETGFDRLCDLTISVFAREQLVVKRLAGRGYRPREVRARLKSQLSASEKRKRSDLYIENTGSKRTLIQKTKSTWNQLKLNQK